MTKSSAAVEPWHDCVQKVTTSRLPSWARASPPATVPASADRFLLCHLQEHSRRAADALGVKDLFLYDLPDNRFDTHPILDVVKIVEELIQQHAPNTIFTHGYADLNVDHQVTHRAVLTATRPIEGHCVRNLYTFEIPSSTDWSFHRITPCFQPNTFFDIESTIEVKKRAMACYEAEVRTFPHPRSGRVGDCGPPLGHGRGLCGRRGF
jgi:hypothetical protein